MEDDPKPGRRFRFSLRALLILVTLAALYMPWLIAEYRHWSLNVADRHRAVAINQQFKGSYMSRDGIHPFKPTWNPKPRFRTLFVVVTVFCLVAWLGARFVRFVRIRLRQAHAFGKQ